MASQGTQRTFTLGGSVLLTLACSVLVGWHVILILGLIGVVVAIGIGYVDYVQWWAGWWHTNEQEDKRVQYAAFGVAFVLAMAMAASGATVLALMYERFQAKEAAAATATTTTAKTQADIAAEAEFNKGLIRLREGGASQATINRYIASYEKRKKAEELNKPAATLELPKEDGAEMDKVMTYVRSYGKFGLFLVPIVLAIIGQFVINFACMLPGGAGVGQTSSGQAAPGLGGFFRRRQSPAMSPPVQQPAPATAAQPAAKHGTTTFNGGGNFTPPHQ